VKEAPAGDEPSDLYALNTKYMTLISTPTFGGTIEAYTYPSEFAACDGSDSSLLQTGGMVVDQQARQVFGLSYRIKVGSELGGPDAAEEIHVIYGCLAKPSERPRNTVGETPEATLMSWEFTTTPVPVQGLKPTSHLYFQSEVLDKADWAKIEKMLWGAEGQGEDPYLPTPDEWVTLLDDRN